MCSRDRLHQDEADTANTLAALTNLPWCWASHSSKSRLKLLQHTCFFANVWAEGLFLRCTLCDLPALLGPHADMEMVGAAMELGRSPAQLPNSSQTTHGI